MFPLPYQKPSYENNVTERAAVPLMTARSLEVPIRRERAGVQRLLPLIEINSLTALGFKAIA